MELGIAGWSLHREVFAGKTASLLDLPAIFAGFGIQVIEVCQEFFPETHPEYLAKLRKSCEKANVRVVNIAVDVGNIAHKDPTVRRVHVEALKQWFHIAKAVGSEAIRINSGWTDEETSREVLDRIVGGYLALLQEAEFTGVRLVMENHGGPSAYPEHIRYILDTVDSAWFGACPDFGNFPAGYTYDGLEVMLPRASLVHAALYSVDPSALQVKVRKPGPTHIGPAEFLRSEFDLGKCIEIVKSSGYDGPICLEWKGDEPPEREAIPRGLDLIRSLI